MPSRLTLLGLQPPRPASSPMLRRPSRPASSPQSRRALLGSATPTRPVSSPIGRRRPGRNLQQEYFEVLGGSARLNQRPQSAKPSPLPFVGTTNHRHEDTIALSMSVKAFAPRQAPIRGRPSPMPAARARSARQRPAKATAAALAPLGHRPIPPKETAPPAVVDVVVPMAMADLATEWPRMDPAPRKPSPLGHAPPARVEPVHVAAPKPDADASTMRAPALVALGATKLRRKRRLAFVDRSLLDSFTKFGVPMIKDHWSVHVSPTGTMESSAPDALCRSVACLAPLLEQVQAKEPRLAKSTPTGVTYAPEEKVAVIGAPGGGDAAIVHLDADFARVRYVAEGTVTAVAHAIVFYFEAAEAAAPSAAPTISDDAAKATLERGAHDVGVAI